jgi:tRNA modification GTPase
VVDDPFRSQLNGKVNVKLGRASCAPTRGFGVAGYVEDTIAAIATPSGSGAIGILRISGRDARGIARRVLRTDRGNPLDSGPEASHRARRARLIDPVTGEVLDEVLVITMWAPRSYTGEDVVEIQGHGGAVLSRAAIGVALAAGARPANPGEFTQRAFLNGRLDLCQAEAVADLIGATSESGLKAAARQLSGHLSARLLALRESILDIRALVEAYLDFPDEDLPEGVETETLSRLADTRAEIETLAQSFGRGRLVREGVRVVLAGRPNVGKSSLLNALLGRDRALVSDTAGTTRDYLEEPISLGGVGALVCDTAGIRREAGEIEQAGIARSAEKIEEADVVVAILDGSEKLTGEDHELAALVRGRRVVTARNKADLPRAWSDDEIPGDLPDPIAVSAMSGAGIQALTTHIIQELPDFLDGEDRPMVTNARHYEGLVRAAGSMASAQGMLEENGALELVAADLLAACSALEELVGVSDHEAILDRIFERFCVGK